MDWQSLILILPILLTKKMLYCYSCIYALFIPLQFAYKLNKGTDDAVLTMMNFVTHLQNSTAYARILFLDFTSAFNTMRVDILLER